MENRIGRQIADLRKKAGMTQIDLANKLNVSNKTISKWERAVGYPDVTVIAKMAEVFGVSTDELLGAKNLQEEESSSAIIKKNHAGGIIKILRILIPVVAFVPLALTAILMPYFPDLIPAHYTSGGEITRWGSKFENLIFPITVIVISILGLLPIPLINKVDAKINKQRLEMALYMILIAIAAYMTGLSVWLLLRSYGISISEYGRQNVDVFQMAGIIFGAVWTLTGYLLLYIPQNQWFGLRTNGTLSNKKIWKLTHFWTGLTFVLFGLACMFLNLFINKQAVNVFAITLPCLVVSLGLATVEYLVILKKRDVIEIDL